MLRLLIQIDIYLCFIAEIDQKDTTPPDGVF